MDRITLKEKDTIFLSVHPDGRNPEEYRIRQVVGLGSSTICYEAIRLRDDAVGKLKEFYPADEEDAVNPVVYSLLRHESGQLTPGGGTIREFPGLCGEYLEKYRLFNETLRDTSEIIRNYVPVGDVLYGCPQQLPEELRAGGTTVYIWSPGPVGQCFDQYLAELRANAGAAPEKKIHDILKIMMTLSDCMAAFHCAGLLHLDLKPSNFLVPYTSSGEVNTGSISLFDINTICRMGEKSRTRGTPGYRAWELLAGAADFQADIYSLGCILFQALVISDSVPDGLYRDSYYSQLPQLVKNSRLISGSELSRDGYLVSRLTAILQTCLHRDPEQRYDGCDRLLEALKKAYERTEPYAVTLGSNKRMRVVTVNEKGMTDPGIVIRKLLYNHPLFEAVQGKTIRVLVIGSGIYGQKFIDIALEAGQMYGYQLDIRTVSKDSREDRDSYLAIRPALPNFVSLDGQNKPDAYASLTFAPMPGDGAFVRPRTPEKKAENLRLVRDILKEYGDCPCSYVFIALGSTELNQAVGRLFEQETENCPICCANATLKKAPRKSTSRLIPVCVNEPITPESIDPQLERMAFNCHMVWNTERNLSIAQALEAFRRDKYNYDASLAYALSIRYKLYSIGIALKQDNPPEGFQVARDMEEAAALFARKIPQTFTDGADSQAFRRMIALEHRRWVLSKATDGWTEPLGRNGKRDLSLCLTEGHTINRERKTHPCLVPSGEQLALSSPAWQENHRQKWDSSPIDSRLDPLDRLSVELHQLFAREAAKVRKRFAMEPEDIQILKRLVFGLGEQTQHALQRYLFCLKNVLEGVETYTRQMDNYLHQLEKALETAPAAVQKEAGVCLKNLSRSFYPVREANLYRDYKSNDTALIRELPHIICSRPLHALAMAFEDGAPENGRNQAVFANVASATVLSPEQLDYLYWANSKTDLTLLKKKLQAVLNYLDTRGIRCQVSFTAAAPEAMQSSLEAMLKEVLSHSGGTAVFRNYQVLHCADSSEAARALLAHLQQSHAELFDGSTSLFRSPMENGRFLQQLARHQIPYFEFDPNTKTFPVREGCEYLRYFREASSIRVQDMFALMNAADTGIHFPDYAEDCDVLWKLYTGEYLPSPSFSEGARTWNDLCTGLAAYETDGNVLARFVPNGEANCPEQFLLPAFTADTVRYLLRELTQCGIVGQKSGLVSHAGEDCMLTVYMDASQKSAFSRLFSNPDLLHPYYGLLVVRSSGEITVICSRPEVNNLQLEDNAQFLLLKALEARGYVSGVLRQPDTGRVSFRYTSNRVKKLLIQPGKMLEVYTYFQVLKTGYFDDVVCSYAFRWEEGGVSSRLDLVLTKGFRTFFVECKAVMQLTLDYYHKLHSIADHFGIGTTKVLISNTYIHDSDAINRTNSLHRSRGDQLNIVTISEESEIRNIGQTLQKLMEAR